MDETTPLTAEQFSRRLVELCLRSNLPGIPKKELDQHILLKSAALLLGSGGPFTEKEVSARLEVWVREVCQIQSFDRVSLRRWMVDSGYLTRSRDGASYQAAAQNPGLFAPEVDGLDILALIAAARAEIVRRKQEYLQKSKGN